MKILPYLCTYITLLLNKNPILPQWGLASPLLPLDKFLFFRSTSFYIQNDFQFETLPLNRCCVWTGPDRSEALFVVLSKYILHIHSGTVYHSVSVLGLIKTKLVYIIRFNFGAIKCHCVGLWLVNAEQQYIKSLWLTLPAAHKMRWIHWPQYSA